MYKEGSNFIRKDSDRKIFTYLEKLASIFRQSGLWSKDFHQLCLKYFRANLYFLVSFLLKRFETFNPASLAFRANVSLESFIKIICMFNYRKISIEQSSLNFLCEDLKCRRRFLLIVIQLFLDKRLEDCSRAIKLRFSSLNILTKKLMSWPILNLTFFATVVRIFAF